MKATHPQSSHSEKGLDSLTGIEVDLLLLKEFGQLTFQMTQAVLLTQDVILQSHQGFLDLRAVLLVVDHHHAQLLHVLLQSLDAENHLLHDVSHGVVSGAGRKS